jgi:hypothetical protein
MDETKENDLRSSIIEMAVEAWRFRRVFEKAMSKLDAGESARYIGQFNWFIKKVESALKTAGMRIVDVEGQPYDIGMALSPLNIDDFEPDDPLYVEQMIEPIIMDDEKVLKTGTAMLGRIEI